MEQYPGKNETQELFKISDIIEININTKEYLLPDNILRKHARLVDICTPNSRRSCCFTKAYGRYIEGTGSVFTAKSETEVTALYHKIMTLDSDEQLAHLKQLELRFFTPLEVSQLMSFPNYFTFPNNLSNVQKYRLLGNSINVKVVSRLISLLLR